MMTLTKRPSITKRLTKPAAFTVGDDVIEVTPLPDGEHRYRIGQRRVAPHEVRVNGALRGLAVFRLKGGFKDYASARWHALSLCPPLTHYGTSQRGQMAERSIPGNSPLEVAAGFPEWIAKGLLPTAEEADAILVAADERASADRLRWAANRDRKEREKLQHAAELAEAVEGLATIRERLSESLTNFEIVALERAIKALAEPLQSKTGG